jgi:hypothetical protein
MMSVGGISLKVQSTAVIYHIREWWMRTPLELLNILVLYEYVL